MLENVRKSRTPVKVLEKSNHEEKEEEKKERKSKSTVKRKSKVLL